MIDELRQEAAPRCEPERPGFSLPLFLLLFFFCGPLALRYGASRWRPAECE